MPGREPTALNKEDKIADYSVIERKYGLDPGSYHPDTERTGETFVVPRNVYEMVNGKRVPTGEVTPEDSWGMVGSGMRGGELWFVLRNSRNESKRIPKKTFYDYNNPDSPDDFDDTVEIPYVPSDIPVHPVVNRVGAVAAKATEAIVVVPPPGFPDLREGVRAPTPPAVKPELPGLEYMPASGTGISDLPEDSFLAPSESPETGSQPDRERFLMDARAKFDNTVNTLARIINDEESRRYGMFDSIANELHNPSVENTMRLSLELLLGVSYGALSRKGRQIYGGMEAFKKTAESVFSKDVNTRLFDVLEDAHRRQDNGHPAQSIVELVSSSGTIDGMNDDQQDTLKRILLGYGVGVQMREDINGPVSENTQQLRALIK